MDESSFTWYTQNRLEYLRNQQEALRAKLAVAESSIGTFPYGLLQEFMEIKGRIKELESLIQRAERW